MAEDCTVLLVEDSALMRRLVREMLRSIGPFTILEAADGSQALALLESHHVDVVLSDWNMKPMDGLRLLQAMRGQRELAGLPFVMMTGEQTPETIAQAVAAGVSSYLTKPFGRDQLGKAMARILAGRARAA